MNVKQTLDELLGLTAYQAGLAARISAIRQRLNEEALRRYDEEEAAPTWKAKGHGTVRLDVPDEKPAVTDDEAWINYVREVSPEDVVISYRVRDNVLGAIAARCERVGDRLADPASGEFIPGVEFRKSPPRLVVTLDPSKKREAIAEALEGVEDQ